MILLNAQGVVTSAVVVLKDIACFAARVEAIEEKAFAPMSSMK